MAGPAWQHSWRLYGRVAALAVLAISCGSNANSPAREGATQTVIATASVAAPSATLAAAVTASPAVPAVTPAAPTAKALAIGDPCLVGRWTVVDLVMIDSVSFPGITMTFTGELGSVMTLTADGTETFDLTNSTPLSGSGGGHTISWQGQGVQRFGFHGESGTWAESGSPQPATATQVVVDGVRQPDFSNLGPPVAGSYTCAGSDLTMTVTTPVRQTARFKKGP